MQVFISYRRRDSQYLADLLVRQLRQQLPSARVFLDVLDIDPGVSFNEALDQAVHQCDVVLVIVGAYWETNRLHDRDDYVRRELLLSHSEQKLMVPILHSEAKMPGLDELPAELAWFAFLNAARLTTPSELEADVARLVRRLTRPPSELEELQRQAWRAYERGSIADLEQTVGEIWRAQRETPSPAKAEMYRTLALSMARNGRYIERLPWLARAISASYLTGASNVLGASLLPFYFQLLAANMTVEARDVLAEVARLLDADDPSQVPSGDMVRRLYHEKLAYSYYVEGDHDQALRAYDTAISVADGDSRGQAKSSAGRALCLYAMGEREAAIEESRAPAQTARREGWSDLATALEGNLAQMEQGLEGVEPYEVV